MSWVLFFILLIIAYLLGSIPSAVWIGKKFYNIDIREHGSGNAGTANTFRVLGPKAGVPVFILDVLKGTVAVMLSLFLIHNIPDGFEFVEIKMFLGMAALLGHLLPVFASFKGGKGVATLLGIMLAIQPLPTLASLGIFIMVLLIFRYVSLASLSAGITFPIWVNFVFNIDNNALTYFSVFIALLLLVTHRKNIKRLVKGEESKVKIV